MENQATPTNTNAPTLVGVGSMRSTLAELPAAAHCLTPYPLQQFDNVSLLQVAGAGASKAA